MTKEQYEQAAHEYYDSLELEDFMQSTRYSTQNDIAYAAGTQLRLRGVNLSRFHDLLIQYFFEGNLRQVVPDIFFVEGDAGEQDRGSWDAELEEGHSLIMTMEVVSPRTRNKDYKDSFDKYEHELKVPYYLLIDHERNVLLLHRLVKNDYVVVDVNSAGRFAMPQIEVEVGWLDGWVRFWHRGELLPITSELAQQMADLQIQLAKKDELLGKKDELLEKKDEQIAVLAEDIQQRDVSQSATVRKMRSLVETKARAANRQDIVDQIPTVADLDQLADLLAELG